MAKSTKSKNRMNVVQNMTTEWHRATVVSRTLLSPSVTGLALRIVASPPVEADGGAHGGGALAGPSAPAAAASGGDFFAFLPGQWVDFRPRPCSTWEPPSSRGIGGYSLTSAPSSLPALELAIRRSRHPVAKWASVDARPGDEVDVRAGGTFAYDRPAGKYDGVAAGGRRNRRRTLFVAGGVGINPLLSMIRQWREDRAERSDGDDPSRAALLYSARTREEFLFLDELRSWARDEKSGLRVTCSVSRGGAITGSNEGTILFNGGRINETMIRDAVEWLNESRDEDVAQGEKEEMVEDGTTIADAAYVCGPPGMPESVAEILVGEALVRSADDVRFEKWW
ncbi:hypothetical protein ACHAWF_015095 [Thalassiosira exigua]